jgi:hypothetical protein
VVLFERDPWLMAVGSDFPTIAIWLDGRIVFTHEDGKKVEAWQSSMSPTDAQRIANSVAKAMRSVPAHSSVSDWTDQRTVQIAVRDGSSWRVANVYGLTRDGPPAPRDTVPCPPGSHRRGCGFVERPDKKATEPAGFFSSYSALLAARPSRGSAFKPTDIKVLFWGFDHARGTPVPWSNELPAPPKDLVPSEDGPGDPTAYAFVIPSSYEPALQRLLQTAHSTNPPRGISFNGHSWTVQPLRRYQGQGAVEQALRCARPAE